MRLFCILLSSLLIRAVASFECQLSKDMTLSWVTTENKVTTTVSINSATDWMGFSVIREELLMIPRSGPVHSVYMAGGPLNGRYFMRGTGSSSFPQDTRTRIFSGLNASNIGAPNTYMVIDFSTTLEYSDDVTLNLNSGFNYVIWAQGSSWSQYHFNRGISRVYWSRGICTENEGVTPYIVFVLFIFIVIAHIFHKFSLIQYLLVRRIPYFNEFSMGGAVVICVHVALCVIVFATNVTALGSNYYAYLISTGQVTLMNFWMALIPSSKNSISLAIFQAPFERLIKYHKLVSWFAFVSAFIHAILNARYNADRYFSSVVMYEKVTPVYGAVAFFLTAAMVISAQGPIRRAFYEIFLVFHFLFPIAVAFMVLHVKSAWPGFIPGLVLQAIDLCVRLYHTFSRKTGTLVIADNITTLTAAVETKRRYRGGEYFFVQVEEVSMLEWHPFSLAATTDNSLVFHILANQPGSWTERLQHVGPGVKVHLDGPYGCISLNTFSYQNIVYIAGGIGITALLNSIDNAINNYDGKPSAISTVSLHWSVRGSSVFNLVKDKIASLGVASQDTCKVRFELHIYDSSAANEELFGGLYLVSKGRMDVNIVIQNALSTVSSSKVCVLACGPHGLAQESVNVAQRLGIDVHKETFGY